MPLACPLKLLVVLTVVLSAGDDEAALRASPDVRRAADPMFADGHETAFSDHMPFLLATEVMLHGVDSYTI